MKKKLYLIPFAGGNCYSLTFLEEELSTIFELQYLELPGRGKRMNEGLLYDVEEAVEDYYYQIKDSISIKQDIYIYGHSLGAVMTLRVAKKIEDDGLKIKTLFVSGCSRLVPRKTPNYNLNKTEFKSELRKLGGVPDEILKDESIFSFFEPTLRADFQIIESKPFFSKHFKVSSPIFSMMGSEENGVNQITNWEILTLSEFKYKVFYGGHFFIYDHKKNIANTIISNVLS